jgi:hypothetical protein
MEVPPQDLALVPLQSAIQEMSRMASGSWGEHITGTPSLIIDAFS